MHKGITKEPVIHNYTLLLCPEPQLHIVGIRHCLITQLNSPTSLHTVFFIPAWHEFSPFFFFFFVPSTLKFQRFSVSGLYWKSTVSISHTLRVTLHFDKCSTTERQGICFALASGYKPWKHIKQTQWKISFQLVWR